MGVVSRYINIVFTDYLLLIMFFSGLILLFNLSKSITVKKYTVEHKISILFGLLYIGLTAVMAVLTRIM